MANHEVMSDSLIRDSEISEILSKIGHGVSTDVARMVQKEGRKSIHNSVVASQFDADRLDYMQRDRYMTGSKHSAIDLTWLLANLEIAPVTESIDDEEGDTVETFVLSPKALQAAEAYVLGLFQLYPTIYLHKTTRGAEMLFSEIFVRIVELVKNDSYESTGLPDNHPLVAFAKEPESVERALGLDDFVVWGALGLLQDSTDPILSRFSQRLLSRKLLKCFDIRAEVSAILDRKQERAQETVKEIDRCCAEILEKLEEWRKAQGSEIPRLIVDKGSRTPYKQGGGSVSQLDQINIQKSSGGILMDLRDRSEVVKSLSVYKFTRVYFAHGDEEAEKVIKDVVEGEIKKCQAGT